MTAEEQQQMICSLLTRIATGIDKLVAIAEKRKPAAAVAAPRQGQDVLAVAPDSDLDSQYGDERIKFDPRDWKGSSMKGATMSECPPEYLESLATSFDWFARKNADNGDSKKAGYDKRSAARARGWARRKLDGWTGPGERRDSAGDDFGQQDDFGL